MESGETETCYVVDDDDDFRSSLIALLTSAGYSCHGYALATEFIVEAETLSRGGRVTAQIAVRR